MRSSARINRLERFQVETRTCPSCAGMGKLTISVLKNRLDPEPLPEGCPCCGEVHHIVVRPHCTSPSNTSNAPAS